MHMKPLSKRRKNLRQRQQIIKKIELCFDMYIDTEDLTPSTNKALFLLLENVHTLLELENNKGVPNVQTKKTT